MTSYHFNPQKLACQVFDERQAKMLSFRQAAKQIGLPVSTLHRIETGGTLEPSLAVLVKLAAWLNAYPGRFFTPDGYPDGYCPECASQLTTHALPFIESADCCDRCQRAHDSHGFPVSLTPEQHRLAFPELAVAVDAEREAMRRWLAERAGAAIDREAIDAGFAASLAKAELEWLHDLNDDAPEAMPL